MPRRPPPATPAARPAAEAIVPFDYAATFDLIGQPGRIVQDVINVSADGVFVAVAVGYGLDEDRGRPVSLVLPPAPAPGVIPGDITLGAVPASVLIDGFRLDSAFDRLVFTPEERGGPRGALFDRTFSDTPLSPAVAVGDGTGGPLLVQHRVPPGNVSFLFNVIDSGTGRELQDEPIHNLASLGKSTGERPFRMLARPMTFVPRSSIRLQVVERSVGVRGRLFIVFYGYKVLTAGCAEPFVRQIRGRPECPTETIGQPSSRIIPFDYVATFRLSGRPGNRVEDEVAINADGGFVASAIGYGLEADGQGVGIQWRNTGAIVDDVLRDLMVQHRQALEAWQALDPGDPAKANVPTMNLGDLPLRLLPTSALEDGIRIRPDFIRIAFGGGGGLADVPIPLIDQLFERLNRPQDLSFQYSMLDTGRGVELQNQPIHSIAGLGVADGGRPFKPLFRPMVCLPRSTIRFTVEERTGRGTLFIVLQGYKLLERAPEIRA
jgi:hypothetical protein